MESINQQHSPGPDLERHGEKEAGEREGGERESALFFEDIEMPGNGASHLSKFNNQG